MTDLTGSASLHVFIVDDDEEVRMALRRLLRSMGHRVSVFASAEEYETAEATPDCLIVDFRLPGLNGLELLERLRKRGCPVPIVFITGDGSLPTNGSNGHLEVPSLAKPFDDSELIAAITRAMSAVHEGAN